MGMTPEEYYEAFVCGNLYDCEDQPNDVRRAFNAAVSASQLADTYFTFHSRHNAARVQAFRSIGSFVEHLSVQTRGAFRDVRSISNVYKHLYAHTSPRHEAHSSVDSSGRIESLDIFGDEALDRISVDYSQEPAGSRDEVMFTRKDGSIAKFLPVLRVVVDYWGKFVYG